MQGRERPGDRRPAVEKPRQIDGQLSGGGIAIVRFLCQAFQTDGNEIGSDAGHDPVGRLGLDLKDSPEALRRRTAGIQAAAGEQAVEDQAEGMDVGAFVDPAVLLVDLFWGHPFWRAKPGSRDGERREV